ncbi:hypothetical protein [Paenibacillus sp. An7]|uniref:hypothetical protein n=1 Tax=Paenibacillus sp. An7 TaxID=2689577 RepID=UPI0013568970|nr:hypothetical protein [Paenibacillus sp. An7]
MTDHQPNNKNTPPQEGRSIIPVMDNLERNQSYASQPISKKANKLLFYSVLGFVFLFVLIMTGMNTGSLGLFVIHIIEWTTLYILPWIFLYYFIQFVRAFVKGKQG